MDLYTIFGILSIVASIVLTLIVLIQNSKGGGLSSAFGASNVTSIIGTRRATQDIEKLTWYFGFGLMAIAFMANIFISNGPVVQDDGFGRILDNPTAAPSIPAAAPAQSAPVNMTAPPAGEQQ